jgi:hypothetical protein
MARRYGLSGGTGIRSQFKSAVWFTLTLARADFTLCAGGADIQLLLHIAVRMPIRYLLVGFHWTMFVFKRTCYTSGLCPMPPGFAWDPWVIFAVCSC